MAAPGKPTFSVIGADVVITGDIRAETDLHIDGCIEGDIACATLVQGEQSRIKGHIRAQSARLSGAVDGTVDAGDLVIEQSARVTGDISYDTIIIAQGAQADGRLTHKSPGSADLKLVRSDAATGA